MGFPSFSPFANLPDLSVLRALPRSVSKRVGVAEWLQPTSCLSTRQTRGGVSALGLKRGKENS